MPTLRVNMNFRRNTLCLKLGIICRDRCGGTIVVGHHKKRRRRVLRDRQAFRPNARIPKHGKVRTGTLIKPGLSQSGDFSTRRKAHDPHAVRFDIPFRCPASDRAYRLLGVGQRVTLNRILGSGRTGKPALENKSRDPHCVQPLGDERSFQIHNQIAMSPARANHNGGAIRSSLRRQEHHDRRIVNIRYAVKGIGCGIPCLERVLPSDPAPVRPKPNLRL